MAKQFAFKGFIGVGHESTYGTSVARTTFARFIDSDVPRSHGEESAQTSRNHGEEDVSLGNYDVQVSAKMEARVNTIGAFLKAHAGAASVTTSTPDAVNAPSGRQHLIKPTDTRGIVSWERRLGTLAESELVKSTVLHEVTIELARNMWLLDAKGFGQKDTIEAVPTSPSFDASRGLVKHEATVTLGGTEVGVRSARIRLQRAVESDDYETGSRYRVDCDVGKVSLSAEYELSFRNSTLLKRALGQAGATAPVDTPLYNADKISIVGPTIGGAIKETLEVDMPRCHWQPIGVPMQGKNAIVQRVRAKALYDETAGYVWQAKLINTSATI